MSPPAGAVKLYVITGVFQFFALLFFGLRIWARKLKRRALDASDWLIMASLIICSILTAVIWAGVIIGKAGQHQDQVATAPGGGDAALDKAAKIVFMAEMMWLASNALTKLSTLAFYLSIFGLSRFRYVVYGMMGLTIACFVAFIAKDFLICQPVSRNWTFEDNDFCGITTKGTLATGIGVTLMDIFIVALPMPMLLKLQMPLMKKIMICGIFSIGLIVCIISGLRLASVLDLDFHDLTYTIIPLGIFTLLEPLLGIIAASLPTLQPVLTKLFKAEVFNWTRRGSRKDSSSAAKRSFGMSGSTTLQGTMGSTDTKNFNRLYDHLYPTTPTVTETILDPQDNHNSTNAYQMQPLSSWPPSSGISITKEVQVNSTQIEHDGRFKPLPRVPEEDLESARGGMSKNTSVPSSRFAPSPRGHSLDREPVSPLSAEGHKRFW